MTNNVGIGIGLSGVVNDASILFARQAANDLANAKARQLKQAQDEEAYRKALGDFKLTGDYHRLLVGDAYAAAEDARQRIVEAKASGSPNWQNQVSQINVEMQGRLEYLQALTKKFNEFDTKTQTIGRGKTFFTPDMKKFLTIYDTSRDFEEFRSKLKESGIQGGYGLNVDPESGLFDFNPVPKRDVVKELAESVKPVEGVFTSTIQRDGPNGSKIVENVFVPAVYRADAERAYQQAGADAAKRFPNGIPVSFEDIIDQKMQDDDFVIQFADTYGIDINQPDADVKLKEAMLNSVKQYSTPESQMGTVKAPSSFNITVNSGQPETGFTQWSKIRERYKSTDLPGSPEFDGFGKIGVNIADGYNIQFGPTTKVVNAKTGQRVLGGSANGLTIKDMAILPVDNEGYALTVADLKDPNKAKNFKGFALFARIGDNSTDYYQNAAQFTTWERVPGGDKVQTQFKSNIAEMQQRIENLNKMMAVIRTRTKTSGGYDLNLLPDYK